MRLGETGAMVRSEPPRPPTPLMSSRLPEAAADASAVSAFFHRARDPGYEAI